MTKKKYSRCSTFLSYNIKTHLFLSSLLHGLLICVSEIQDTYLDVKYTDIDYTIFTDGAQHMLQGGSPFERDTYRYTPLMAWMMIPNLIWFPQFGKVLFSIFDLISGWLIYSILPSNTNRKLYSLLWIYNPLSLIISTRGSAESIICTLVIVVIYFFKQKQYLFSGLCYGLVIHLKIYPVIYVFTFYLGLSKAKFWSNLLPNRMKFLFFLSALFGFAFPTGVAYFFYGKLYLDEAWLYHFYRQDIQHNFSPYFYLYQLSAEDLYRKFLAYSAFVPQFSLIIWSAFHYNFYTKRDSNIYMSLFFQTFIFVTLNKVITAQYFEWYISLLPLVAPFLDVSLKVWLVIFVTWTVSILQWLLPAYLLEFRKWNCIDWVGCASFTFTAIHLSVLVFLHTKFISKVKKR